MTNQTKDRYGRNKYQSRVVSARSPGRLWKRIEPMTTDRGVINEIVVSGLNEVIEKFERRHRQQKKNSTEQVSA